MQRSDNSLRRRAVLAGTLTLLFLLVASAQAQTFQVLHSFTGGEDGYAPTSVVLDGAGNLYGDTGYGGNYESSCNYVGSPTGCGVVFKMTHHGSSWIFDPLASFNGANGYEPLQALTIAPNGARFTAPPSTAVRVAPNATTSAPAAEPSSSCGLPPASVSPSPVPGLYPTFTSLSAAQVTANFLTLAA